MQPVRPLRQIRGPGDSGIAGLSLRNNLNPRSDFPAQWEGGSLEFSPRWLTGPDHHRLVEEPVRRPRRQGIEDGFQRHGVCHMAVTLTIHEVGLNAQVFGFGEKVHSARRLQMTVGNRRQIL